MLRAKRISDGPLGFLLEGRQVEAMERFSPRESVVDRVPGRCMCCSGGVNFSRSAPDWLARFHDRLGGSIGRDQQEQSPLLKEAADQLPREESLNQLVEARLEARRGLVQQQVSGAEDKAGLHVLEVAEQRQCLRARICFCARTLQVIEYRLPQ